MSFPKYGDDYYSDFFEKKFLLKKGKVWVVYCIVNPKNEIYVGHSSDIRNRLTSHNTGRGAVLTKGRGPWEVFHLQLVENRQDAVRLESITMALCAHSDWLDLTSETRRRIFEEVFQIPFCYDSDLSTLNKSDKKRLGVTLKI
jgi:predicted GIY-YIG superfamily endonuclease